MAAADTLTADSFASGLVAALEPTARRELARAIAVEILRPGQSRRIADQLNPDGSPYEPRKPQLRRRQGAIKRRAGMFGKLRTARYLKIKATPEAAIVGFAAEVERIANVHQRGLRDRVNRRTGLEVTYPARELLGITEAEKAAIRDRVTAHLAHRL